MKIPRSVPGYFKLTATSSLASAEGRGSPARRAGAVHVKPRKNEANTRRLSVTEVKLAG